jgi:hypothetical protein
VIRGYPVPAFFIGGNEMEQVDLKNPTPIVTLDLEALSKNLKKYSH